MRWRRVAAAAALVPVLLAPGPAAAAPARWSWPVPDHRIVRGFEAPASPWATGHRGVDLPARVGDPIRSPDDGVVAFAGRVVDRGVLAIDHDGVRSSFEPVRATVAAGDRVRRGQVVAELDTGGGHTGVLHLGARIRRDDGWAYVSPLLLLGVARRSVLLPLSAFP